MKSETVPALPLDAELKKEENICDEQKVDVPKQNASPTAPESSATVPPPAITQNDDKMEIDEPVKPKIEMESPDAVKGGDDKPAAPLPPNDSAADSKMDIDVQVKCENETAMVVKASEEPASVPTAVSGPLESENVQDKKADVPEGAQAPPFQTGTQPTAPAPVLPNTAAAVETPAMKPIHTENVTPSGEKAVSGEIKNQSGVEKAIGGKIELPPNPAMNAPTPPMQTAAANVYGGYYPSPYPPPPIPPQYYPPHYYSAPYQSGGYSPYFHPEPSQNPTITTPTPPIQTTAQNVAMPPTSQPAPLPPQVQMPPAGNVPPPPTHVSNPNPNAGLPTPPPPPQSH